MNSNMLCAVQEDIAQQELRKTGVSGPKDPNYSSEISI